MKKLFRILVFGAFVAIGIGMLGANSWPQINAWIDAKTWQPVPSMVLDVGLHNSASDGDGSRSTLSVVYEYQYQGNQYQGTRVGLFDSALDNEQQRHWFDFLQQQQNSGSQLSVYVNPQDPWQSLIDRDVSWLQVAVNSVFTLVFVGVGLIGIIKTLRGRTSNANQTYATQTAMTSNSSRYKHWGGPVRRIGGADRKNTGLWFALIWLGVSMIPVTSGLETVQQGDYWGLLAMLFPAFGILALWHWWTDKQSQQLTGEMELTMDPYPGSIGGQVGGRVSIEKIMPSQVEESSITLCCLESFEDDDDTPAPDILWEQTVVPKWQGETQFDFYFGVPESLPESGSPLDLHGIEWRLALKVILADGTKILRNWNALPVFATGQTSSASDGASKYSRPAPHRHATKIKTQPVLDFKSDFSGYSLEYPAFGNLSGFALAAFGGVFIWLGLTMDEQLFKLLFPLVGAICVLLGAFDLLKSYEVTFSPELIRTQSKLLGIPLSTKSVIPSDIRKLEPAAAAKAKSKKFHVRAVTADGQNLIVAKNLNSANQASAAIEQLKTTLNLRHLQ